MISLNLDNLSAVKNFLVGGGYSRENFANSVKDIHGATVEVVNKSDLSEFVVIPIAICKNKISSRNEKNNLYNLKLQTAITFYFAQYCCFYRRIFFQVEYLRFPYFC